jgi:hypothetical protein
VGQLLWEKRTGSADLLFSELMIWGYLRRWRNQRRLASAVDTLGSMSEGPPDSIDRLSTRDQAKLLERLVAGMETRDPYLHGHSRRVARHSWMIARRMGLARAEVARIRTAAAIHDVGKIDTPKAILHKAGPLTIEEYEVIKRHPDDGARMSTVLGDAALTAIVRDHHERLDGSGYPNGLSGEAIPLGARIIAVADTFDAITSVRPYRPAGPHKKAIDILKNEAGTKLDPDAVRAFCRHYAGRGPLALWSSLTGLPARVASWLASSAASVASVAKVVAIAALVGGAAATTSTLAPAVAKHSGTSAPAAKPAGPTTPRASASPLQTSAPRTPAGPLSHGHAGRGHHRVRLAPSVGGGSATPVQTLSVAGGTQQAQPAPPVGSSGRGNGPGTTEPPGKSKEPPAKAEPPGKSKEPPAKSEPPGRAKEPRGKATEPPVKGEPPGRSKEPPAKTEPPGQAKEPPVKAEPPGKGKEPAVKTEPPVKGKG